MKPLRVDFAPRRRWPWWSWILLTAVLLAIAADQGRRAWQVERSVRAVERQRIELTSVLDRWTRVEEAARAQALVEVPYARDASEVAKIAAFPVARVLHSLEAAQVEGVRVVAVEASAADGTARAELEFASHDALERYLDDINAGESRRRWALLQAQTAAAGGQGTATIVSSWVGGE